MRHVISDNKIDVILHTAAYKHVPLVDSNAVAGIRNNVFGTDILTDAAGAASVERFTLIATDKTVRPVGIMGCTKRLSEMIVQDLATGSTHTRFSMVRFGNVLGSSGSAIPLFQDQIARGGPVTLTHEDIARQMIEGAGYTVRDHRNPNGDIEVVVTGLRPGEKLHEELLIGADMPITPHPKIMRAQENYLSELEMANMLQSLRRAVESRDLDAIARLLDRWIEADKPLSVASGEFSVQ